MYITIYDQSLCQAVEKLELERLRDEVKDELREAQVQIASLTERTEKDQKQLKKIKTKVDSTSPAPGFIR